MRFRKKAWAKPELNECQFFESEPQNWRGRWREHFSAPRPLHMEIGCGKGVSTAQMVKDNPSVNYLVVDIISDMLAYARRNIFAAFAGEPVDNVVLFAMDAMFLDRYMAKVDQIERIYLNFSNPWDEKVRHEKRRLTHPRQLMQYREILAPGGEIWFKTDSDVLFEASLGYFAECGFSVRYLTRDLHASGFSPNYLSEHEKYYAGQGVPIKFVIARMEELHPTEGETQP